MKWHLLLVGLVVGVMLLGCGETRPPVEVPPQVLPKTIEQGLAEADASIASLEKALEGSDLEAIRLATNDVTKKLGGLASLLTADHLKAVEDARKAGTQAPPDPMAKLGPSIQAAGDAFTAVVPPNSDISKVKELLPQIKSGVEAMR